MRPVTLIIIALFASGFIFSQESNTEPVVKHEDQIKLGFSNQIDVVFHNRYDTYYYYDDYYYNDPGVNLQLFLAYEHIWEFPNKVAFALEPKIGSSIRQNNTNGFAGLNTKFYWINTPVWRMGLSVYGGYGYSSRNITVNIPMDGGNYYQKKELNMHFHSFSFDVGLIPFQFRFKKVPITLEAIFALGGLTTINGRSEKYEDVYGPNSLIIDNYTFPYFLKGEFKIGFVFPQKK